MGKPPAFQFYPKDWLSSTRVTLMTPAQEGAYIRLLCYCWDDPDCSLPNDDKQLARMSRLGDAWYEDGTADLIKGCFVFGSTTLEAGAQRLVHKRLKQEREKQERWREKSATGGVRSGKARRRKKEEEDKANSDNNYESKGGSTTLEARTTKGGSCLVEPNTNPSSSSSNRKNVANATARAPNAAPATQPVLLVAETVAPDSTPAVIAVTKQHPAIRLVEQVMTRCPPKIMWPDIAAALTDAPDVARVIACRKAWVTRGYRANSLDWLEWYTAGAIPPDAQRPRSNGNGHRAETKVDGTFRAFEEYKQEEEEKWQTATNNEATTMLPPQR